jgi:hypothetical protein
MMLRIMPATVAKEPGHRGEHEGNRKTIVQGMPVETGEPVADYRILCGPRVHRTPGIPCALLLLGRMILQNSDAVCRENENVCLTVIARSTCDEAIQSFFAASGLLRRNDGVAWLF